METKVCIKCKEVKNLNNFYFRKDSNKYRNQCKVCWDIKIKEYFKKNKEKRLQQIKEWSLENKNKVIEYKQKWLKENKDFRKEVANSWVKRNLDYCKAQCAKRRALKLQRTPSWADLQAIEEYYLNCPEGYEVDHIVPLQGKLVSGLHVLENLQYLPASENRKKSNKFEVG